MLVCVCDGVMVCREACGGGGGGPPLEQWHCGEEDASTQVLLRLQTE